MKCEAEKEYDRIAGVTDQFDNYEHEGYFGGQHLGGGTDADGGDFQTYLFEDGSTLELGRSYLNWSPPLTMEKITEMVGSLEELLDMIKTGYLDHLDDWTALPTFGGDKVAEDFLNIWSWDEDNVICGRCAGDMRIVSREQFACGAGPRAAQQAEPEPVPSGPSP